MAIIILNSSYAPVDKSNIGTFQDRVKAPEQRAQEGFHAQIPLYAQIHRKVWVGGAPIRDKS